MNCNSQQNVIVFFLLYLLSITDHSHKFHIYDEIRKFTSSCSFKPCDCQLITYESHKFCFQWHMFFVVQNIIVKNYLFIRIVGQLLITRTFDITIGGTGIPTLIPGFAGGNAVLLDGKQHLTYGDQTDSCFGDVEKCTKGVTIRFNLRLTKHSSKCFVFSNGGEEALNYGYAMWFENNKLYTRTSNRRSEWTISTSSVKVEKFMQVEMSWSLQNGLQLSIDKEVKVSSKRFISRPSNTYTAVKDFVIGGSSKKDRNCGMAIDSFTIVFASAEIIKRAGIKTGDFYLNADLNSKCCSV